MIIRLWQSPFDMGRFIELQQFADEVSAPLFRQLPGCLGYLHAVRGSTWITQTFWESEDHIRKAEASEAYRAVVDRIQSAGFLTGEQTTEVFMVTSYAAPSA